MSCIQGIKIVGTQGIPWHEHLKAACLLESFKQRLGQVAGSGSLGKNGGRQLLGVSHHDNLGFWSQQLECNLSRRLKCLCSLLK